ncbi:MAG: DUF1800 domain-containing protein [Aestuariivirga sp.]
MRVSRRSFNAGLLAAGLTPAMLLRAAASPVPVPMRLLNRLTFGATPEAASFLERVGIAEWLEAEIAKPAEDDGLKSRLAGARLHIEYEAGKDEHKHSWKGVKEDRPYRYLSAKGDVLVRLTQWETVGMDWEERIRPGREVQSAAWIRAVHADAQLREVMTQFWHEHFSVNAMRDEVTAAYFPPFDAMLRRHALGNFREMLGEVARAPAMLSYLNNAESRASPANENYARELFELHTLGAGSYLNDRYTTWRDVPGALEGNPQGYIDQDVYEAARAFTGWSIGSGQWIADGENAPLTGAFHYIDGWHDPYQKRVLGVEFPPNAAPMADGERVLDLAAFHPGTARFIAEKLVRRLLADEPPKGLVAAAAETFTAKRDAPDQIAHVLRTIVLSGEFAELPPKKMKRPFEFLVSFYRATGAEMRGGTIELHYVLMEAGWLQHEWRAPTGHPDVMSHWANTYALGRIAQLALTAFDQPFGAAWQGVFEDARDAAALSAAAAARLLGRPLGAGQAEAIAGAIGGGLPEDAEGRAYAARTVAGLVALTPEFLLR